MSPTRDAEYLKWALHNLGKTTHEIALEWTQQSKAQIAEDCQCTKLNGDAIIWNASALDFSALPEILQKEIATELKKSYSPEAPATEATSDKKALGVFVNILSENECTTQTIDIDIEDGCGWLITNDLERQSIYLIVDRGGTRVAIPREAWDLIAMRLNETRGSNEEVKEIYWKLFRCATKKYESISNWRTILTAGINPRLEREIDIPAICRRQV